MNDRGRDPGTVPANAIAVIGMAGRFPASPDLDAFWRNLRDGVECLTRFSDDELAAAGVPEALRRNPAYVPVRGAVRDCDTFAASFFGVNPREAELTDPQHRLLLEVAWEAMESAGYDPGRTPGPVGVFAGVGMNTYMLSQVIRSDVFSHPGAAYEAFIGNDKDFSATRVSSKLGLNGPAVNVQTACSTSLVAVHLACQALLTFQCDMALAGAAAISSLSGQGYVYSEGMILSPDGHCRPFDARAGGTVPGEAVAMVTLRRLADAVADRDPIRAVILGTGVNNDGALKAGFTAPSVDGQCEAIVLAHEMAQVD
ncbi:MAG: polyketide synthase, partial [Vicinamibacterales bacterium]